MGIPLFPVFEEDLDGYEPDSFDGRALGEAGEALEALCEALGLAHFDNFLGMSEEEAADRLTDFEANIGSNEAAGNPELAIENLLGSLAPGGDEAYTALQDELSAIADQVVEGKLPEEEYQRIVAQRMGQYFMSRFGSDTAGATEPEEIVADEDDEEFYETVWHDPAKGLAAVSAMRKAAENDRAFVSRYPEALAEIREIEAYLEKATAKGVRFAIEYDI